MKITPTKILTYGLLVLGFLLLAGGRAIDALRGDMWTGIGIGLIGLSCVSDAWLPGGSRLTDEQIVKMRQAGLPYRPGIEGWANGAVGVILLLIAAYFLFG